MWRPRFNIVPSQLGGCTTMKIPLQSCKAHSLPCCRQLTTIVVASSSQKRALMNLSREQCRGAMSSMNQTGHTTTDICMK
eukprot:5472623-Amphidinium_carterae.1